MKETMWAELRRKDDRKNGKRYWHCHCESDQGDSDKHNVIRLDASHFPEGTRLSIEEPSPGESRDE